MRLATVVAEKPEGGYRLIRLGQLLRAWDCYRSDSIELVDLRVYLACHEMHERRRTSVAKSFTFAEVAELTGCTRPRTSVARLEAAGLLEFDGAGIEFPEDGSTRIPVPRRMLRHLAEVGRAVLIATVLGHLIRCLFWKPREEQVVSGGRCKASHIARDFRVDLRRVKEARTELVDLGWLVPLPEKQWAWNRWGGAYQVSLTWSELPPPPAPAGAPLPPPDSDRNPHEGEKDQEPGEAGVSFTDVRPEDLTDTARTLELHAQAVARGVVTSSEADRLRVVAAAEHARSTGTINPCGLFVKLLRDKLWKFINQDDEDRARRRIHKHLFPGPHEPARATADPGEVPTVDGDRAFVLEVVAAARRAGYRGDPFYVARQQGWTRDRWDAASGSPAPKISQIQM